MSTVRPCPPLRAEDAVPGRVGGESKLLFVFSPDCGGFASMVNEDDDVALFWGSDDCDISAGPAVEGCIVPDSLSSSLSLLKGDRGNPILVVRLTERFLSGVGESGWLKGAD